MQTNDVYQRITDTIIEMLENHKQNNYTNAWFMLSGDSIFAKNIVSNHTYSGINQLMLNYIKQKFNYNYNRWLTFKQISALNAKIKKGSKAAMVVYKSNMYLESNTDKNITKQVEYLLQTNQSTEHLNYKKIGYLKSYNVFNVSSVEGLPHQYYQLEEIAKLTEFEKDERAEELIQNTKAEIVCSPQNRAYYQPMTDKIFIPLSKQFVSKEAYYSILFHELGHWTGNPKRLNREQSGLFGSKEYAFEELIAEINSAYVSAYLGYESRITDNVDYIDNWLTVMKNDKKFVLKAASQAQMSADYLLEFTKVQELAA